MCAECLTIKGLHPPFASGGLWRMWRLLQSASIRHHPPEAIGGTMSCTEKDLSNIRHLRAEREGDDIICGGLPYKKHARE